MKLLILDRGGVINEDSPDYIRSVDDGKPLPGSMDAIARLCSLGFEIVVATNQSGLARLREHNAEAAREAGWGCRGAGP